jgi:mono/diheme cytochrome c family protein
MKAIAVAMSALLLGGCADQSMRQQKRYETFGAADLWPDGSSARPIPHGTLAQTDAGWQAASTTPPAVTAALLQRGRERYDIYCSPCHGLDGKADGMIVERGFPKPPSYHTDRLRAAPARYFFDVITKGYGVMYPYAARVTPEDRWAIVAYVRALQMSQHARLADVPEAREKLP